MIEADKFARVSKNEADYLITSLITKSGKDFSIIKNYLNALNAHDILDNIS
ncbi:hypothetical protein ACFL1H_04270 [Nanoarchaeota archaeon]